MAREGVGAFVYPVREMYLAARATEAGPSKTTCPGTTGPSLSAEADCDELAVTLPLAVRLEAEVLLFRLTDGVDTGVQKGKA